MGEKNVYCSDFAFAFKSFALTWETLRSLVSFAWACKPADGNNMSWEVNYFNAFFSECSGQRKMCASERKVPHGTQKLCAQMLSSLGNAKICASKRKVPLGMQKLCTQSSSGNSKFVQANAKFLRECKNVWANTKFLSGMQNICKQT